MCIYMQCTYSTCMHALVTNSVGLRCILCACNGITLLGVVVCEHVCLCAHTGIYGHLKSHCRPAIYGIIWSMSWFGEYRRLLYGFIWKFHWIRIHRICVETWQHTPVTYILMQTTCMDWGIVTYFVNPVCYGIIYIIGCNCVCACMSACIQCMYVHVRMHIQLYVVPDRTAWALQVIVTSW